MSFTCPICGMTSHNPNDEREGYCGNCHDWTRELIIHRPGCIWETGPYCDCGADPGRMKGIDR
jgi:hypothetical protein